MSDNIIVLMLQADMNEIICGLLYSFASDDGCSSVVFAAIERLVRREWGALSAEMLGSMVRKNGDKYFFVDEQWRDNITKIKEARLVLPS